MTDENEKEKRRYSRYILDEKVLVDFGDGKVEATSQDISAGGVSITSGANVSNDAFVQLHIENVGDLGGHVVRELDGGFAVEFDAVSKEKIQLEDKLKQMFAHEEPKSEITAAEEKFKKMFESGED